MAKKSNESHKHQNSALLGAQALMAELLLGDETPTVIINRAPEAHIRTLVCSLEENIYDRAVDVTNPPTLIECKSQIISFLNSQHLNSTDHSHGADDFDRLVNADQFRDENLPPNILNRSIDVNVVKLDHLELPGEFVAMKGMLRLLNLNKDGANLREMNSIIITARLKTDQLIPLDDGTEKPAKQVFVDTFYGNHSRTTYFSNILTVGYYLEKLDLHRVLPAERKHFLPVWKLNEELGRANRNDDNIEMHNFLLALLASEEKIISPHNSLEEASVGIGIYRNTSGHGIKGLDIKYCIYADKDFIEQAARRELICGPAPHQKGWLVASAVCVRLLGYTNNRTTLAAKALMEDKYRHHGDRKINIGGQEMAYRQCLALLRAKGVKRASNCEKGSWHLMPEALEAGIITKDEILKKSQEIQKAQKLLR